MFELVSHAACGRVLLNGNFQTFGVCNLGNTSPVRVFFLFENVQNLSKFQKDREKLKKIFLF